MAKYDPTRTLIKTLVYPIDANPDDFFPECIKFGVQKRIGMNIEKIVSETSAGAKELVKMGGQGLDLHKQIQKMKNTGNEYTTGEYELGGWGAALENLKNEFLDITKQKYDDIDLGALASHAMNKISEPLAREHARLKQSSQSTQTIGNIYMNMPNSIQFTESASWGGQSLGVGGDAVNRAASGESNADFGKKMGGVLVGSAGNIAGGVVGGMLGGLSQMLGIGGGALVGALAGENLQRGFESGLSIKQNPYMEMMFSGIDFRSFRFDFVLRPRSTPELDEVCLILKAFREYSRPSWNPAFGGQAFMDYPLEFKIEFLTLDEGEDAFSVNDATSFVTNEYLPKLKTCVLSNVETNYTPQSIWAAHKDGAPVAVTLGLSFQETELVMAEDVQLYDWPRDESNNPNSSEPIIIQPLPPRSYTI